MIIKNALITIKLILISLLRRNAFIFPDIFYIKIYYYLQVGKLLNLKNPHTFNEKIQWLKLYDRQPKYTLMVDKYEAKKYVEKLLGAEFIIPNLGVWDCFEDIDFSQLPNQFVLKVTHDSGGVVICKDKQNFNISANKILFKKLLKRNFFNITREWPYKNVKPRIIAEEYIVDESGTELKDYKIFNFNGKAHLIQVDFDRFSKHKRNLYTTDWDFINSSIQYPNDENHIIEKPKNLEKMLWISEVLSKNIPHVRIDLYSIGDKIYFGEMTFHHGSGHEKFIPESLNYYLGELLEIPNIS